MYQRLSSVHTGRSQFHSARITVLPGRRRIMRPAEPVEPDYDEAAGRLVVKLVSVLDRVEVKDLYRRSRGKAEICLSRQKAMYLMHTVFSSPYHKVALFFRRDRTTIAHACRLVEDLRDDEEFDKHLEAMENLLVSARALYEAASSEVSHDA